MAFTLSFPFFFAQLIKTNFREGVIKFHVLPRQFWLFDSRVCLCVCVCVCVCVCGQTSKPKCDLSFMSSTADIMATVVTALYNFYSHRFKEGHTQDLTLQRTVITQNYKVI